MLEESDRTAHYSTSRWIRWGFLAITLVVASALIAITVSTYARVRAASELLERGLSETFMQALWDTVRATRGVPAPEDLKEILEVHSDAGLLYVALGERDGKALVEAGTPAVPPTDLAAVPPGMHTTEVSHRVRVTLSGPFPRSRRRRSGSGGHRGHRPLMVLEFEPRIANQLRNDGKRAVLSSAAASVVLLGAAAAFWKILRERERQQERVDRERHLATLGEMSAVLAHEIRNPLASLKGHAQLLVEQLPVEGKEHRKARRIVEDAQRLETLSSTLLDFVKSGTISRESVDPKELLRQSMEALPEDRIVLEDTNAPATWPLDPIRMGQVFTNLLQNAIEATSNGEPVRVRIGSEGTRLKISVRDHGEGIRAGEEGRIFEAFRTHRVRGTGLGLAVARRIVELHGGTILAANHADGGAVFTVEIPR